MDENQPNFSRICNVFLTISCNLIKLVDEFPLVFERFILNLTSNFSENKSNFHGYFHESNFLQTLKTSKSMNFIFFCKLKNLENTDFIFFASLNNLEKHEFHFFAIFKTSKNTNFNFCNLKKPQKT